jgi:hypothetical protein
LVHKEQLGLKELKEQLVLKELKVRQALRAQLE